MAAMLFEQPVLHDREGGDVYRHDAAREDQIVSNIAHPKQQRGKTHKMANATRTVIQFTAQLPPEQVLEIPINFTTIAASQKTISRQLRMTLALKLLHRENRAICSVSSW
jgi:hypothetical protein